MLLFAYTSKTLADKDTKSIILLIILHGCEMRGDRWTQF
jgi:hypothetical protein